MAVEIRQMVVKSNVVQRERWEDEGEGEFDRGSGLSDEDMKVILAECRHLVMEVLREVKDR
ncbi:MAG TPA: hypothetical protein DIW28_07985 [Zetaproteobacteria bacterium]|nr:hypothetical protein [Zetaproteobacteria bacterium]